MRLRRELLGIVAVALVVAGMPAASHARATFGLQLKLGVGAPIFSDYVESTTILTNEDRGLGEMSYPYIGDVHNTGGWNVSFSGQIREWELSLSRFSMPYDGSTLYYAGRAPAERLGPFDVNDAGIGYTKLDSATSAASPYAASDSLVLWTLDAGRRWYFIEQFVESYVPFGAGIVWASIADGSPGSVGAHLWAGVATDIEFGDFAVVFDARLHYIVTNNAAGVQRGADNAAVVDDTVVGALVSSMAFGTFEVGLRYRIN